MKKLWTATMAAIIAFGTLAFASCDNVTVQNSTDTSTPESATDFEYGGFIVGESTDANGVSLLSTAISSSDFETYGISAQAESAVLMTATVTPEYAVSYATLTWQPIWVNASSEWASGKIVTDYVTVSKADTLSATVTCLQPFGEQVEIVCTVNVPGKTVSDKATCDYVARPETINWGFAGMFDALQYTNNSDNYCNATFTKNASTAFEMNIETTQGWDAGDMSETGGIFGVSKVASQTAGTTSSTYFTLTVTLAQGFYDALIEEGLEVDSQISFQGENFQTACIEHNWFCLPGGTQEAVDMWYNVWMYGYDEQTMNDCGADYLAYKAAWEYFYIGTHGDEPAFYVNFCLTDENYQPYEEYYAEGSISSSFFPTLETA